MSKVLILGASGMLGHTLLRYLSGNPSLDVFATVRSSKNLVGWLSADQMRRVHQDVDVHPIDNLVKVFADVSPDIVVNCIGIIKQVPEAEDPLATINVNALFPHRIALLCGEAGARMIHVSTDCVYDGKKGSYTESDLSNAIDLYGRTKLLGEVTYPHCVTLRTSIIGHELKGDYGLVEWFLGQKETVHGYRKVIFSGLPTVEIARIIEDYVIPNPGISGLYHVSSSPISKYELLQLIKVQYGKKIKIEPEDSFCLDRSLDSSIFRSLTGYNPPEWTELVHRMYQDYLQGPYQYS